ncbi:hypothetical protein FDUTEX481_01616 [Tolypothrix sp. PCC 7601]|nr:hypothetical protein FDUTEX481_01616 [Tolypothrix sp. PCC 7601]
MKILNLAVLGLLPLVPWLAKVIDYFYSQESYVSSLKKRQDNLPVE